MGLRDAQGFDGLVFAFGEDEDRDDLHALAVSLRDSGAGETFEIRFAWVDQGDDLHVF